MKHLTNFGSMKQPFCFILDKKSTIRWSDNKIVCSYTQTEERLDFISTRRIDICLPFVSCITCSRHSCLLDDFVSSWIKPFYFILDKKSTIRWSDNKIVCSYTECRDFINTRRIKVCLPFACCITCSIHSCLHDDFV